MRDNVNFQVRRFQATFGDFTTGQKVVAVLGTLALLLAGFMVFRWAAAPSWSPLYSNLASSDASAIVEELDKRGVQYELTNGGNTIMVPQDDVYATRIALSGDGLPSASDSGYSILDKQNLSTSQFQEQTSYKRAMEGELANTIEALDGVDAAIVHLAIPQKEVFSDQQDPTTAAVLLQTRAGTTLTPGQVQAVVNLVASSVDGLSPDDVTVTDQTGTVLSAPAGSTAAAASSQTQQVEDFQDRMRSQVQAMLDRVLGPNNSTVQITADLGFDKTTTDTTRYFGKPKALSASGNSETYTSPNGGTLTTAGGVVGPDGQMETGTGATGAGGASSYVKKGKASDNVMDNSVEHREAAPGGVESLHVGVALDTRALKGTNPQTIQNLIASTIGIDPKRGDTVDVQSMAFDRTAETAAAKELAATAAADKKAAQMVMIRNGGLVAVVVLVLLIAWLRSRKRNKARMQATEYVVEQLRRKEDDRAAAALDSGDNAALLALEASEQDGNTEVREEIAALVESQPEDVAALLRGWLVEPR